MAVISYVHFFAEVAPRLHQVNAHAMWLMDTTFCSHQIDGAKTSRLYTDGSNKNNTLTDKY